MDYRDAARAWRAHPDNPDGWYDDPEAVLALNEAMAEADRAGRDPMEPARRTWRRAAADWRAGSLAAAGTMVAVEEEVTRWRNACRGGTCHGIMDQCSKHSMEYQNRWGRAANE